MKSSKKLIVLFYMLSILSAPGFAQTINEIFDKNVPITWLGLDFSGAKFLGDREKYGSSSDVKFLIKSWNDVIEREKDKYNVARATKKTKAEYRADVTGVHNEELDISEMLSNNPGESFHLKAEDISTIVNSYDFQGLAGIGLMFNVESFNKFEQQAAIWVTFINLNSKEVLFTDRMLASPGGAGMRNYWARAVLETLEKMEKKQMEVWRKKYVH